MIERRRMMLEQGELPSGYKRCKYLESSAKQYIDTGITSSDITGCYYEVTPVRFINNSVGVNGVAGENNINAATDFKCWFSKRTGAETKYSLSCGRAVHYNYTYFDDVGKKYTVFNMSIPKATGRTNNIFLFAMNEEILVIYHSALRMHIFRVLDGNRNLRCFVPALDAKNKPCMFDVVTQSPFYNKGAGEFGYELMDGTYVAPV